MVAVTSIITEVLLSTSEGHLKFKALINVNMEENVHTDILCFQGTSKIPYNKISNCAHNETQHCLSSHIITFSATRQIVVVGGGWRGGAMKQAIEERLIHSSPQLGTLAVFLWRKHPAAVFLSQTPPISPWLLDEHIPCSSQLQDTCCPLQNY